VTHDDDASAHLQYAILVAAMN